jgi:predicted GH43/DUF377 family glycosyl hydrolase
MLLKYEKPEEVLSRTEFPILEPETSYEKMGIVNNVVFPCGAAVIYGILYVYYGGADKVIGLATIPMKTIVSYLLERSVKKYL